MALPDGAVSKSYTESFLTDFAAEISSTTDIPMCTARAAQTNETAVELYLEGVRREMALAKEEGCFRKGQTWADARSFLAMDEQGFGPVAGRGKTVGEKQRVAKKRLIKEGKMGVIPRASSVRNGDKSVRVVCGVGCGVRGARGTERGARCVCQLASELPLAPHRAYPSAPATSQTHKWTICWMTKPDPVQFLRVPPLVIDEGKTMTKLKISYKEGPDQPLKNLADLKQEKGDDWVVWTNEHGGADQHQFRCLCKYIIEKEAEIGIGKGGETGWLQFDHHGSRDDAKGQRELRENNFRMLGPASHASHYGASLDCGWNAFADLEIGKMIATWYADARPGQVMHDADFMGIVVRFYYRCKEGDLMARARETIIKSWADVGVLDGKRSSMIAFDKVAGVGEQFVDSDLAIGEKMRRTRASQRCRGVTGTDTRAADGEVINIYTDSKTQVTSIRSVVHKAMYDKELRPRSEYSKLEKAEKEARKLKLPAPGSGAGADAGIDSDSSEELDRRTALDSRHGYFWTEDYQRYLDKFEKKKDSEAVLSMFKPFMKRVACCCSSAHATSRRRRCSSR